VLAAIWIGVWSAIFSHKLLALRAVATGCATNYVFLFLLRKLLQPLQPLAPMGSFRLWIASLSFILVTQAVTGWVVARTHRSHPIPMVSVFATWSLVWGLVSTIDASYATMLLLDSLDQPRFRPYLALYLAGNLLPVLAVVTGLLLGGIAGAHPRRQPSAV
jgi:hypothetical protein